MQNSKNQIPHFLHKEGRFYVEEITLYRMYITLQHQLLLTSNDGNRELLVTEERVGDSHRVIFALML